MSDTAPSRPWWLVDALLVVVHVALARAFAWVAEDAFISFRYARNLVEGHGLRFNVGEGTPVEGYSNLLWVLVDAVPIALGLDPAVVVPWLSTGLGALLVLATIRLARGPLGLGDAPARAAGLLVAVSAPTVFWATSGLEPVPLALLFLLTAWGLAFAHTPRQLALTALAGLALALIRTEGVAWLLVLTALAAWLRTREDRPVRPAIVRAALPALAGFALVFTAKALWHGDVVSNVAYAKVGLTGAGMLRGLGYVAVFHLVLLWPFAAWWGAVMPPRSARWTWVGLLAAAFPAWTVVVGGDYMAWFRFLVPAVPWLALLLSRSLTAMPRPLALGGAAITALLAAVPLVDGVLAPQAVLTPLDYSSPVRAGDDVIWTKGRFQGPGAGRKWSLAAQGLHLLADPGDTVVLSAIGYTGWFNPELTILDQCGLVTPKVAHRVVGPEEEGRPGHEKCTEPDVFYADRPDLLAFATAWGEGSDKKIRRQVERWDGLDPKGRYAPDLALVEAPEPVEHLWLIGLRKVPPKRERAALIRRFEDLVDAIERGELPDVATAGARREGPPLEETE